MALAEVAAGTNRINVSQICVGLCMCRCQTWHLRGTLAGSGTSSGGLPDCLARCTARQLYLVQIALAHAMRTEQHRDVFAHRRCVLGLIRHAENAAMVATGVVHRRTLIGEMSNFTINATRSAKRGKTTAKKRGSRLDFR